GTSTNEVAQDYADRLSRGIASCEGILSDAVRALLSRKPQNHSANKGGLVFCHLLNISQCEYTEFQRELAVVVYNPDTESLLTYVRLPVGRDIQLVVTDPDGLELDHQVLPVAPHRLGVPERTSTAPFEIVFPAAVPPLGISVYQLAPGIPAPDVARTGSIRDDFLELEKQLDYVENKARFFFLLSRT
ncbi:hypothetical protein HPB47_001451, partial [Ixodes persulcatus]